MTDRTLWEAALWLYGLANLGFWAGFRQKRILGYLASWLAALGVAAHLSALVLRGVLSRGFPVLQAYDALGLFALLTMTAYLVVQLRWPVQGLGFFASALAFVFTLVSLAYPGRLPSTGNPELSGVLLHVHIGMILVSFGVLALAFCASLAYLVQDFFLRGKRLIPLTKRLPPLNTLDTLTNQLVSFGFILLSAGIALGSLWAERSWGTWWVWEPKQGLALLTWVVYAIYIHVRTLSGWKGRRSVLLILVGFVLVVATFLGANFFPGRHRFVRVNIPTSAQIS